MDPSKNPNLQRAIKETLYRLKIEYGVKVDVYKLSSTSTDYDTGTISRSITKNSVRRAVKMPEGVGRLQYISPNFTQTQKPFITKGLGWDEVTNIFVFEGRDLPNYNFEIEDWLVHDHTRYEIKVVEELGGKAGWVVGTTHARGTPAEEFHDVLVEQDISVTGDASGTTE